MTRDKAIKIICDRHLMHRDVAAAWVDTMVDLGMLKLVQPCVPPPEHAAERWHWCEVPVDDKGNRRVGCFEWVEGVWGVAGRGLSPEIVAELGWRYIKPAAEPMPDGPVNVSPYGVHEGQGATADMRSTKLCVPPNLPLPTGMHMLRLNDGKTSRNVKARWHGKGETWLIAEGYGSGSTTPEQAAAMGFEYLAALPDEGVPS